MSTLRRSFARIYKQHESRMVDVGYFGIVLWPASELKRIVHLVIPHNRLVMTHRSTDRQVGLRSRLRHCAGQCLVQWRKLLECYCIDIRRFAWTKRHGSQFAALVRRHVSASPALVHCGNKPFPHIRHARAIEHLVRIERSQLDPKSRWHTHHVQAVSLNSLSLSLSLSLGA